MKLNSILLKKLSYLSFFLLIRFSVSAQEQKELMNVLFIIADDLTANALSSYENGASYSPNIAQLSKEGIRYTRAYSQYPVCGPSRASLMFGYYPTATGVYGYTSGREKVGDDKKSIAQLFKDNGYYTARVSKIFHMGIPIDIENGTHGADDKLSWTERFNSPGPEWKAKGEGELVQNNPYGKLPIKGGNVMTIVKAEGDDLEHSDGRTAQKAIEILRAKKKEPFFLAVGLVRPHVPFVAPNQYFNRFPYQEVVLPPKVVGDWDDLPANAINYVTTVNGEMTPEQQKKAIAAYYASVYYMDAQVGKILASLKDEGLEKNTIVVFTSDHGFHLGEHDFWMKVSLHEESVRVPLIIKVPGKKSAVCNSLVELIDLYPTLAALAHIKPTSNIQGKSLEKTIEHPDVKIRDFVFSVSQNGGKGGNAFLIRSDKWSYIQYGEHAENGAELYDMEHDLKQYNNLVKLPAYSSVVEKLKRVLINKIKETKLNDIVL
ncbi:arylsulfatase A-like enzyme [Sphingobacterium sp. JUb20]|nr:arylsulfatase A-like enzyme [Sphingobacterium sp. JUb20]